MNPKSNPVGWFEIYVQDMKRATAFYENTLLLKLQPVPFPEMEMSFFPMEESHYGAPGALVKMTGVPSAPGGTLIYFSCDDCAEEMARAVQNGGKVFKEKFSIGEYGFVSLVFDTEGNMIGLHSQR